MPAVKASGNAFRIIKKSECFRASLKADAFFNNLQNEETW
jgi:hypothetical protein